MLSKKIKLQSYKNYLKYILEHKKNVFNECLYIAKDRSGICWRLILRGITHDISKFTRKEFKPYALSFCRPKDAILTIAEKDSIKKDFEYAWLNHHSKNSHHYVHYYSEDKCLEMKSLDFWEMMADWNAMSVKFNSNTQLYYLANIDKIKLHPNTRRWLEYILFQTDDETYYTEPYVGIIGWCQESIDRECEKYKNKVYLGKGKFE